MNPTWSWYMIFLVYCCIQIASILLMTFEFMFISHTVPYCFPFTLSLSDFGVRVITDLTEWDRKLSFLYSLLDQFQQDCCWVARLNLTLCNPMDCSVPGFPALHHLLECAQTHVHWVSDAIQPSHPLLSSSPPAFKQSQHQCLFQWVDSSHQEAKVLELQHQHQSFQWIVRVDFLQDWLV